MGRAKEADPQSEPGVHACRARTAGSATQPNLRCQASRRGALGVGLVVVENGIATNPLDSPHRTGCVQWSVCSDLRPQDK